MASKFIKQKRLARTRFAQLLQLLFGRKKAVTHYKAIPQSIIILAQEKIGDSILLTPLIKNLKLLFPHIEINLVCFSKASANFFKTDEHITKIHQPKIQGWSYYRFIQKQKFDILFNTKDSPSTNFLLQTALIKATYKIGHKHPHHHGLFNYEIPINFHNQIAIKNCALLTFFKKKIDIEKCRPYIPPTTISDDIKRWLSTQQNSKIIGINISAGSPDREWQEEKWEQLIRAFPQQNFIAFAAPHDTQYKKRLEILPNVITTPSTKTIYEVGLLVQQTKLLITPDTSLVHVASCYNIPIIGLYTIIEHDLSRFAPYLIKHEIVRSHTNKVQDITITDVEKTLQYFLLQR